MRANHYVCTVHVLYVHAGSIHAAHQCSYQYNILYDLHAVLRFIAYSYDFMHITKEEKMFSYYLIDLRLVQLSLVINSMMM